MIIQDLNSDDDCVPIPEATLAEICRDEVNLGDFSKMRIFKTLFSEEGIPLGLKGQFMKKLVNICKCSEEESAMQEQMFFDMANKPNAELDL